MSQIPSLDQSVALPLSTLQQYNDPFVDIVWFGLVEGPLTRDEVRSAIEANELHHPDEFLDPESHRSLHAQRVAWFVVNGWTDPISLEIQMRDDWYIWDGNHRFAAAIYREDKTIEVMFGGYVDLIEELFFTKGPDRSR